MYGQSTGLQFYRSHAYRQKGRGIGSFFGNLFSRLLPFARNTLLPAARKHVLPHAAQMAKNITADVLMKRRPIRHALKDRGLEALKGVGESLTSQSGSGIRPNKSKKRKKSSVPNKNSKRGRFLTKAEYKRKRKDIFG